MQLTVDGFTQQWIPHHQDGTRMENGVNNGASQLRTVIGLVRLTAIVRLIHAKRVSEVVAQHV